MPRGVLPADEQVGPDRLEPRGVAQANTRVVWQRHARDGGAEAALGQTEVERVVERAAPDSTPSSTLEGDADLAGSAICRARLVWTARGSCRSTRGGLSATPTIGHQMFTVRDVGSCPHAFRTAGPDQREALHGTLGP